MRSAGLLVLWLSVIAAGEPMAQSTTTVDLPAPCLSGDVSLERLLANRRSVREFPEGGLRLTELGQLLWAAQGITHPRGFRTAPSAGALYPLELYVVAGQVEDLAAGTYHYQPEGHQLEKINNHDQRKALAAAALSQPWVREAPVVIVLTAVYERTTQKYGERGQRYVHMEAGHAAQNLFLQAGALELATVVVGAFDDPEVAGILPLPAKHRPLMLMPVGRQ